MLTAVKNQLRVCLLSIKYNIMREMLNKVTFLTNICFMMLNNASFLVQWAVLFRLKEDIGGYSFREVMLLWGLSASSFGLSHILFARVFSLPELIINGKLDAWLVLPKNVLLGVMTSATRTSAIGDLLYGILVVCLTGFQIKRILLFLLFTVTGAVIITAFALLVGSLSFWFVKTEIFGNQMLNVVISFATYPDGIFKGAAKFLLYSIIPTGMMVYQPVHMITDMDLGGLLMVLGYAVLLSVIAAAVFYRGLRNYSSGNLMGARV
ncbi:MAG: ABC-2 family transporter protein [Lachnospiraceae bacterium]|nr:ABC-2 family transporter protein [Lachnospiraceae bacterium]